MLAPEPQATLPPPLSGFLAGVGSVLDLTGTGVSLPLEELHFQPTEIFRGIPTTPPLAAEEDVADQDALIEDWQTVGSDMREAMREYRRSLGT